jgi:hypothetical protein
MDEFYGGYNYTSNCDGTTISSAENVDDVDEDDVLIILLSDSDFQDGESRGLWGQKSSSRRLEVVVVIWMAVLMFLSKRRLFLCLSLTR